MTLETFFIQLNNNSLPIALLVFAAPWLIWVLCHWIPGQWEEPFLLSVNIALATASVVLWAGYLAYASNTAGWQAVVKQADMLLLLLPPYYIISSIWVARQRMPLPKCPLFARSRGSAFWQGSISFCLGSAVGFILSSFPACPFQLSCGFWQDCWG